MKTKPVPLLVRICNPYTNSAVLIKISIFNTHPLGSGKKCGKMVLKTAKRVKIILGKNFMALHLTDGMQFRRSLVW
jgi:hypothetical protein